MTRALSDPLRGALKAEVRRALGLSFTAPRVRDFDAGIRRAMELLAIRDPGELLLRVAARDPAALEALGSALTVGETYFFRHPEHFDLVRVRALPEALRRREGGRVRLWSAGCATGEEPYSLAILALDLLGNAAKERVEVLATDLNPTSLARARAGRYGAWSFRGVPDEVRRRWFIQERSVCRVIPELHELVRFELLNLAALDAPFPADVDVILCRNVLIYLDQEARAAIFARMARALGPGGRLILSPSDPMPPNGSGLAPLRDEGYGVYRRGSREDAEAAPTPSPPSVGRPTPKPAPAKLAAEPAPTKPAPPRAAPFAVATAAVRSAVAAPPPPRPPPAPARPLKPGLPALPGLPGAPPAGEDGTRAARELADAGATAEALRALDAQITAEPLSGPLYLLRAAAQLDAGQAGAAAEDARRAVLLEPRSPAAHLLAAAAQARAGEDADAARALRNARALLLALPADEALPDFGGISAGDALAYCERLDRALASRPEGSTKRLRRRAR